MTINAGVWIDHHKAVVVLLTEEGQDVLQFLAAGQGASARSPAGLRAKNAYTPNDFVSKDTREQRVMARLNEYYDDVIACVRYAQAILILGPGDAKGEFRSRLGSQKVRCHIAEIKTAAKLTDHQITDYVRQHFQ